MGAEGRDHGCASLLAVTLHTTVGLMRSAARFGVLRDRLDLAMVRLGTVMFSEPLLDRNGRHHPALRSGPSARASARLGDRWHALWHLFAPSTELDRRGSDVSGIALATKTRAKAIAKAPGSGRNAAA
jgi:hypothetical protein